MYMTATQPQGSGFGLLGTLWNAAESAKNLSSSTWSTLSSWFAEKEVSVAELVTPYLDQRHSIENEKTSVSFFTDQHGKRWAKKLNHKSLSDREVYMFKKCQNLPHVVKGSVVTSDSGNAILMEDAGVNMVELMLSLEQQRNSAALPESLFKSVADQIIQGLAEMHTDRLIHSDIKLANITIDDEGQVKLIDLETVMTPEEAQNSIGYKSTYGYLAPECYSKTIPPSKAIDIFAAGVVLYELLSGERFISGTTQEETNKNNENICKSKESLKEFIDEKLAYAFETEKYGDLLRKMLSFNPDDRPSAQEALNTLREIN
ncbi:hypothetical protein EOPP23_04860 [Endozoicomonas sp. OPT23]|nr:hypothetical protein [Endozoicomonas sp. OPT23]